MATRRVESCCGSASRSGYYVPLTVRIPDLWYRLWYQRLARLDKLIKEIRNNPKSVRFDDACKVAKRLGFAAKGGKGSHNSFSRTGEPTGLNFQKQRGGTIKPYQARQLIDMIDKYYDSDGPEGQVSDDVEDRAVERKQDEEGQ